MGIELSKTRFDFAEHWKFNDGYHSVENINKNVADIDIPPSKFDWFIIIDNTLTYLHPENSDYPKQLLLRAFKALCGGGCILLDFFNYSKRIPGIELQNWNTFPKTDPFAYALYSNRIENGINTSKTIFIKRNGGGEQIKIEFSKVYSLDEISQLLNECGFRMEETFCNFDELPYLEKSSERLVLIARKPLVSKSDKS